MKIARKTLIRLTEETIEQTRGLNEVQQDALREVAAHADKILLNGWYDRNTGCGCLVGNLCQGPPAAVRSPYMFVGSKFNELLNRQLMKNGHRPYSLPETPIGVIG